MRPGYDYETTYYYNGNTFTVNGEYVSGEAWINEAWYTYERDDDGHVLLKNDDGAIAYVFNDNEDAWDAFARSVLA